MFECLRDIAYQVGGSIRRIFCKFGMVPPIGNSFDVHALAHRHTNSHQDTGEDELNAEKEVVLAFGVMCDKCPKVFEFAEEASTAVIASSAGYLPKRHALCGTQHPAFDKSWRQQCHRYGLGLQSASGKPVARGIDERIDF